MGHIRSSSPLSLNRVRNEPAVCLITVGGLEVAGQIEGCTPLRDIRKPTDTWDAGEILLGPGGQQAFETAGIPQKLRHGSLLGGVLKDGIATIEVYDRNRLAFTVPVHHNAAYFHVNHTASAAVNLRLVFKDAQGRVIHARPS